MRLLNITYRATAATRVLPATTTATTVALRRARCADGGMCKHRARWKVYSFSGGLFANLVVMRISSLELKPVMTTTLAWAGVVAAADGYHRRTASERWATI